MSERAAQCLGESHRMAGLSRRGALCLLAAVALAAAPGCAWKPEIVTADPSLTGRNLVEGKLLILPVRFDTDKVSRPEQYNMFRALGYSITHVRPDLPLITADVVQKAFAGSPEEEAMINRVYQEGGPDPKAVETISQSTGARYLVLTRLHYEQRPVGGLDIVESTLSGSVALLSTASAKIVWEGKFSATRSGVDTLVTPQPSRNAVPFFGTIVDSWPR